MGISNRSEPAMLRSVLDDVFGGHHGGYERGQGSGYSRSLMKDTPEHRASRLSVGLVNARLQQLASENEDLKEKMVKQHEYSLKQEGEMREEMAQLRALVQIVSNYINHKSFVKLVQSYETNCHVYKYAESFF